MKTILTISLFLTLTYPFKTFSQTELDSRIIEFYGQIEVKKLTDTRISYLNYYLDNSYEIMEISRQKDEKFTLLSELLLESKTDNKYILDKNINNINILKYSIKRSSKLRTTYRLDNTNKVLVFYSNEEFTNNYNTYLKDIKND